MDRNARIGGDDGVEPEGARGTTRLDGIKNILLDATQKSSEREIHISIVLAARSTEAKLNKPPGSN